MITNGYQVIPNLDVPADEYHIRNAAGAVLDVAVGEEAAVAKAKAMVPGDAVDSEPKPESQPSRTRARSRRGDA